MPHYTVSIAQTFPRSVAETYGWLSDHEQLGALFGAPVRRIRDGDEELNGVGSVRRIGPWPLGVQETVTAAEPDRLIEYRITRFGGPIRNHRGRLEFSPIDGGSRVDWTIEYDALPGVGGALRRLLGGIIGRGLRRQV